jgi:arsenate reductase (glutaredoxin)
LLNRQGTTWRKLDPADQAGAGDVSGALRLMQQHSSTIKRPVVDWPDGRTTVGFVPELWERWLP